MANQAVFVTFDRADREGLGGLLDDVSVDDMREDLGLDHRLGRGGGHPQPRLSLPAREAAQRLVTARRQRLHPRRGRQAVGGRGSVAGDRRGVDGGELVGRSVDLLGEGGRVQSVLLLLLVLQ